MKTSSGWYTRSGSLCHTIICTWLAGCLFVAPAQTEKKTITNADVVKMIEDKLPESVILSKIQNSETKFDTSPETLGELNKKGVSEKILTAMVSPKGDRAPEAPRETAAAAATAAMRVAIISDGTTNEMMQIGFGTSSKPGLSVFLPTKVFAVFNGAHAAVRTANPKPNFEVGMPGNVRPSDVIALHKPRVKSDSREIPIGAAGIGAKGVLKEGIIPIKFQELAVFNTYGMKTTLYRVQPSEALKPGEYILQVGGARHYDFGVDAAK